jgi:hypothetical protein
MNRSRRLQLLAFGVALAGVAVATSVTSTEVQASSPAAAAQKPAASAEDKKPKFPAYPEAEYERSVIRVPIGFPGEKKPREIVELTAFMKLEREAPVRNTIGYRQFEFTIREWELFGYSETLGAHLSFAASKDVVQPKSLCVALQKNSDYPALIVYNAIYDVFLDGRKIISQMPGVAMARGVMEIPPRNITVAFQKPFAISRKALALHKSGGTVTAKTFMCGQSTAFVDESDVCVYSGTCEDMQTITEVEFDTGLKEAKAIRGKLATLRPKPTQQEKPSPAPGGQR